MSFSSTPSELHVLCKTDPTIVYNTVSGLKLLSNECKLTRQLLVFSLMWGYGRIDGTNYTEVH